MYFLSFKYLIVILLLQHVLVVCGCNMHVAMQEAAMAKLAASEAATNVAHQVGQGLVFN